MSTVTCLVGNMSTVSMQSSLLVFNLKYSVLKYIVFLI